MDEEPARPTEKGGRAAWSPGGLALVGMPTSTLRGGSIFPPLGPLELVFFSVAEREGNWHLVPGGVSAKSLSEWEKRTGTDGEGQGGAA